MAGSLFVLSTVANTMAVGSLTEALAAFAVTYWLHSTLLLGATWLLIRSTQPNSHFMRERLWKLAATAGLATAAVQLATGLGFSLLSGPEVTSALSVSEALPSDTSESESILNAGPQHLTTSLKSVQDSLSHLRELPETLTRSKSLPEYLTATSPGTARLNADFQPTVSFLPLDDASTVAVAARPNASVGTTEQVDSADSSRDTTASAEARAAADPDSWFRTLVSWTIAGWFSSSLLYFVWQSLQFHWQMRHVREAARSHRRLLVSICERRGVKRRVRLLKSDRFGEPVAYGLFRATILIPAQVENRLNRDELAALLSHELAHLTRGDIVWLVIGRILGTCFAFQPLNFMARRRWQEHAEFQCDDWAVDRTVDRLTLARSLTLVAEWQAGRKTCAGVVSAGGSRFHLSARVERLVTDAVPDVWQRGSRRLAIHVATLLLAGAVIVFGPQTGSAERMTENAELATAIVDTETVAGTRSPGDIEQTNTEDAISTEDVRTLVREVEGLSGDVSELLTDLRTIEPLLAELEQRPELANQISQLRTRIGQLRIAAEMRTRQPADL